MGKFSRQIQWDVTRSVALASTFYFFYHGGKTCLFPFITLYFRRLGLSATQAGLITGSKSLVWYFAAPLWMVLSRKVQKTKVVLGTALLIAIACNLTVTLIPPVNQGAFTKDCNSHAVTMPNSDILGTMTDEIPVKQTNNTSAAMNVLPAVHLSTLPVSSHDEETMVEASATSPTDFLIDELKTLKSSVIPPTSSTSTKIPRTTTTTTTKKTSTTLTKKTTTMTEKSTTTTTTTTTAVPRISSTTRPRYKQMAGLLLSKVKAANPKNVNDIQLLVSQFVETRNWPNWRQKTLARQIDALLDKDDTASDKKQNVGTGDLDNTKTKVNSKELVSNSPSALGQTTTTAHLENTLDVVVEKLLPMYLQAKSNDPSISVGAFIKGSLYLIDLSSNVKEALMKALSARVKETASQRQKRSLSEEETKSLTSNNTVDTGHTSSSGVIDLLNRKSNASVAAIKILAGDILPHLTNNAPTFMIILIIIIAGEVISAPIDLLSDNSFYELLDELDSLDRYGKHKIAALASVVIFGISVSLLVFFSPCLIAGTITRYHIHFYAFATLVGLAFLVIPFYPTYNPRSNSQPRVLPVTVCPTCCGRACSDCRHRLLLVTVFIVGVMQAGMQDFILWDVQNLPQSSELVYGSFVSANGFAAILGPILGQKMMSVIKPAMVAALSLYCISVQLLLCSFMSNAWFIVPLQLMNIFGVSLLWTVVSNQTSMMLSWHENLGAVRRVNDVHVFAKASQKRALYTAYLCTYQGIAFAVGSVLSGIVYDLSGGSLISWLRVGSVIVAIWASVYMMFHCCCVSRPKPKKYSKLLEDSDDEEDALYDMRDKNANCTLGFSKSRAGYIQKGKKRIGGTRKKRRTKKLQDSSSEDKDDLDQDWLAMSMRKDSRLL